MENFAQKTRLITMQIDKIEEEKLNTAADA